MRPSDAARAAAAVLHGDGARAAGDERHEAVERLEGQAAAAVAAAQVVEGAVADAGGGEGGPARLVLGGGEGLRGDVVEGDDEGHAEVGEERGVECGAEVAAPVNVDVVPGFRRRDDAVVGGFECDDAAGDDSRDLSVDGTARDVVSKRTTRHNRTIFYLE